MAAQIVRVRGMKVHWPRACVCCGGAPETTDAIQHVRTSGRKRIKTRFEVPYCSGCLEHRQQLLGAHYGPGAWLVAFLLTGPFGPLLLWVLWRLAMRRAVRTATESCCGNLAHPVRLVTTGFADGASFYDFAIVNEGLRDVFRAANSTQGAAAVAAAGAR